MRIRHEWTTGEPGCGLSQIGYPVGDAGKNRVAFTRALLGPDQINEYASVVVLQVGKLVGEVGEIIAHACLQVFADVVVNRGQDAAAVLINIRQTKLPDLG